MKFRIIVADPPYHFRDKLTMSDVKRGAASNYQGVLKISDLLALPVKQVAEDDALLALWVPSTHIPEGLEIMKAWGFKYKQTKIWVKTKQEKSLAKLLKKWEAGTGSFDFASILDFKMGHFFRQTHEVALIGARGSILKHLKSKSQRSVIVHPSTKHSAKPETLQDELEIMFPGTSNLELFARRERDKWITLGNEVGACQDIRQSLPELVKL